MTYGIRILVLSATGRQDLVKRPVNLVVQEFDISVNYDEASEQTQKKLDRIDFVTGTRRLFKKKIAFYFQFIQTTYLANNIVI
jgi:hypothetical protein